MPFRIALAGLAGGLALAAAPLAAQPSVDFPDFYDCSALQLNGSAACTGGVLRLTDAVNSQAGSAFVAEPIQLLPGAAFSAYFVVNIGSGTCEDADGPGADGLTFTVQAVGPTELGTGGALMGYEPIPSSFAVELDTWDNEGGWNDPDGNHLGLDLGGSASSVATAPVGPRMNDGTSRYVWIDYDGTTLEARIDSVSIRPASPTLSSVVDLESELGTTLAWVGFTAGTGGCAETHDIVAWQLTGWAPLSLVDIPTLSGAGLASLAVVLVLSAGLVLRRRRT